MLRSGDPIHDRKSVPARRALGTPASPIIGAMAHISMIAAADFAASPQA
jgi:hypothetical protein